MPSARVAGASPGWLVLTGLARSCPPRFTFVSWDVVVARRRVARRASPARFEPLEPFEPPTCLPNDLPGPLRSKICQSRPRPHDPLSPFIYLPVVIGRRPRHLHRQNSRCSGSRRSRQYDSKRPLEREFASHSSGPNNRACGSRK